MFATEGPSRGCLRTEKESQPMALSSIRKEVCIQTGQLKQVCAGWHRSCWPSLPFLWWEGLWGHSFAIGIHSNSDGLGRWFAKSKAWNEGEKPSNLEVLSSCHIKLKTSQLSENCINHSQNIMKYELGVKKKSVKNNLLLVCPLLSLAWIMKFSGGWTVKHP